MKLLIHAAEEDAQCLIDGHPFVIPPGEVFEVPSIVGTDHNNNGPFEYSIPDTQVADLILKHCWFYGMTEVPVIRSKGKFGTNYQYDAEVALGLAREALIKAEETILTNYVRTAQERMSQNLPAMPPNGRALYVVEKRKIDLKREYNIVPVGYGTVAAAADRQEEIEALKRKNDESERNFKTLQKQFQQLMEKLGETSGKTK